MSYEVRAGNVLIASSGDAATALLLAHEWLREAGHRGTHTCVVQELEAGLLTREHVVALSDGPLRSASAST